MVHPLWNYVRFSSMIPQIIAATTGLIQIIIQIVSISTILLIVSQTTNASSNTAPIRPSPIQESTQPMTRHHDIEVFNWTSPDDWSNTNNLSNEELWAASTHSKWRPTIPHTNKQEYKKIVQLKKQIVKKAHKIVRKKLKQSNDLHENTTLINTYNRFKTSLKESLGDYTNYQIKHRRPQNIDHSTIDRVVTKLKERDDNGDRLIVLQADKNYGNVTVFESEWSRINDDYFTKNRSNFMKIECDR
eukprot:443421_1